MEAKEKASRLVEKYQSILSNYKQSDARRQKNYAKLCAIICVDEILESLEKNSLIYPIYVKTETKYWESVKQEIQNV
jgi:hypothetical protein